MIIIYQPYYKFTRTLRYLYTQRPRVFKDIVPTKHVQSVVSRFSEVERSQDFVFRSVNQYLSEKQLFNIYKERAINTNLFKFLKKELEDYYGEENVDYEIERGQGFSFCVYFNKLNIQTDYKIIHEIRDCYFIINCTYLYDSSLTYPYRRERIQNLYIFRSTFWMKEKLTGSTFNFYVHSHSSTNTFEKIIKKNMSSNYYEMMCTGGGDNIASEIKTFYYEESKQLKFLSFVYHIKDLLQYENSQSPFYSIRKIYHLDSNPTKAKNLEDLLYKIENYFSKINYVTDIDNDLIEYYFEQFEDFCQSYFGSGCLSMSITRISEFFLSKVSYQGGFYEDISEIDTTELISFILKLYEFFRGISAICDDLVREVSLNEEEVDSLLSTFEDDAWKKFYSYYSSKHDKTISVQQYENLPNISCDVEPYEVKEGEVEIECRKDLTIVVFKNKHIPLRIINKLDEKESVQMYKEDFYLQVHDEFVKKVNNTIHEKFSSLSKLARENTLFQKHEKVQAYIVRRLYDAGTRVGIS